MANETELEKIDRAAEYFERYFEFEDAVTVSKENKEYLKTYIHDNDYVVKNFNIKISAPAIMPTIISFVPRSSHSSRKAATPIAALMPTALTILFFILKFLTT